MSQQNSRFLMFKFTDISTLCYYQAGDPVTFPWEKESQWTCRVMEDNNLDGTASPSLVLMSQRGFELKVGKYLKLKQIKPSTNVQKIHTFKAATP